jgi:hypothetical protein
MQYALAGLCRMLSNDALGFWKTCNHSLNMATFTVPSLDTRTSTFNRSLTLCSFTPWCVDQSLTLSNHAGARDNEHDWFTRWDTLVTFLHLVVSCILAIDMGLHAEILGHFTIRLGDFHLFEPLIPYVPPRTKPHKRMVPLSHQSLLNLQVEFTF